MLSKLASYTTSSIGRRAYSTGSQVNLARILCSDSIDPICIDIFKNRGHDVDYKVGMSKEELNSVIGDYDGLVVRSATKVTADVLANAKNMKVIGRAGAGVDNIDLKEATKHGIMVMNTPGGNTVSTAQLGMALLTSTARSLPKADASMKAGLWERKKFMGSELQGKTLAIIGCGRIGQTIAGWAQAFNMKVIGFDPSLPSETFKELGIQQIKDLDKVWPQADFITLHTPLTPDTRNLINERTLNKMKKGVHIINCARGGIIDEEALLEALNNGQVAGAAIDVWEKEPPQEKSKALIAHPAVVSTPHLGASTEEAQINVARDIAMQMCDALDNKDFKGIVNVNFMPLASSPTYAPYLKLAYNLGDLAAQLSQPLEIGHVSIKTYGKSSTGVDFTSTMAVNLISAGVLQGVLNNVDTKGVKPGLINAPYLASDLNISNKGAVLKGPNSIVERGFHYDNLISVIITSKDDENTKVVMVATILPNGTPAVIQINKYSDFPALKLEDGQTFVGFRNDDRPGAVSGVLDVLSDHDVNIGQLTLGRLPDDLALCILTLDSDIPDAAMERLIGLEQLQTVKKATIRK